MREVSIPQAVSTVATSVDLFVLVVNILSFNTASGKYCCNDTNDLYLKEYGDKFQYRKR